MYLCHFLVPSSCSIIFLPVPASLPFSGLFCWAAQGSKIGGVHSPDKAHIRVLRILCDHARVGSGSSLNHANYFFLSLTPWLVGVSLAQRVENIPCHQYHLRQLQNR
ncbi:hypothetical protein BV22DRAFT_518437 [Leucogyrophana mollusca]|uniref:Uncharacterized protein n=1 Tax=Leucogyrophana mollusca TaxID=85980 RepID=A0ACB8BFN4_9AGAM|nr:hypothetical protein BV22DRAFT_518437 [Leucogyrophana mollusca]